MNDRSTSPPGGSPVQAGTAGEETIAAAGRRAERRVLRVAEEPGAREHEPTRAQQADEGGARARVSARTRRSNDARTAVERPAPDSHLLPGEVSAGDGGDQADRRALRSDPAQPPRHQPSAGRRDRRRAQGLMPPRVGRERDEAVTLLQRLRDLTPSWAITEHHARQIAERQARLLLGAAG